MTTKFICLQQLYLTWIKCIRSYERYYGLSQTVDLNDREHRCMGEKSWTSHFKQQFILIETSWRIYDVPRINSWSLWNSSSKWLRSWSRIGDKLQVWPRLITKSLRGDRRVYHVTKLLRLRMPKPTSSQTRCSVWRTWVTNQSKPVRTKLNGIWKIAISKIWTESMKNRWNSSGKYSQESQHWEFLKRFKKYDWITVWTWVVQRNDHLHVNVQRHCMERTRKHRNVWENPGIVANYVRRFPRGRWSFLGLGSEKKGYGTYSDKPDGDWDTTAERMMLDFAESSHPIFRATSALERGEFKSKGKGNMSIHFTGSEENIELNLRTFISANQLSVYGAVADLCKELSKDSRASEKPNANEDSESMEISTELPVADPDTDAELQGNLLQESWRSEIIQTVLWRQFEDCITPKVAQVLNLR